MHRHQWKVTGWSIVSLMDEFGGKNPVGYKTYITQTCETCGKIKTSKKRGYYQDPRR
jgi:hypothetical protein